MTKHYKFPEISTLINANIPVLLHGERGSGKTTLVNQVSEALELPFYVLSMTRQTTLSHIMGFMNVNGIYIPSLFRKAVEEGGIFLFDEIDAADPNVILSLNTLENGYVSFPDTIVEIHKDFRLVATANPFDDHSHYTGRAQLDAASLDRFDKVGVNRDKKLEASLVSEETYKETLAIRRVIEKHNVDIHISMRDTIRLNKRKALNLTKDYVKEVLLKNNSALYEEYLITKPKEKVKQEDITSVDQLWAQLQENYDA